MSPTVVRLPMQYSVNRRVRDVQDALVRVGEEAIVLHMYHIGDDLHTQPRCPRCFNDIYTNTTDYSCGECYGTSFLDGVKDVYRVWAVFNDSPNHEDFKKRGESDFFNHSAQIEAGPFLKEHDYLIRVKEWNTRKIGGYVVPYPKVFGDRYKLDSVKEITMRTGSRYGQNGYDKIGQSTVISEMPASHIIYTYPVQDPVLRIDEEYIP